MEPLLPDRTPKRGGRLRDHRQVIDAIAWKFRTGSQWIHLPREYGSWKGVYTRQRNRAIDGTWERVFTALLAQADAKGDLDWVVSVDSTIVRAHQNAAGARKRGAPVDEPDHHAIGRSRGGLTTKIHSRRTAAAAIGDASMARGSHRDIGLGLGDRLICGEPPLIVSSRVVGAGWPTSERRWCG
jgi:transposase